MEASSPAGCADARRMHTRCSHGTGCTCSQIGRQQLDDEASFEPRVLHEKHPRHASTTKLAPEHVSAAERGLQCFASRIGHTSAPWVMRSGVRAVAEYAARLGVAPRGSAEHTRAIQHRDRTSRLRDDNDFCLDLDRNVARQFGHADGTA